MDLISTIKIYIQYSNLKVEVDTAVTDFVKFA